jgi:hypothetical protein
MSLIHILKTFLQIPIELLTAHKPIGPIVESQRDRVGPSGPSQKVSAIASPVSGDVGRWHTMTTPLEKLKLPSNLCCSDRIFTDGAFLATSGDR